MKKIDYLLSTFLIASLGLNTYLVVNVDRLLKEDFEEIVLAKKISFVKQDAEKIEDIKAIKTMDGIRKNYRLSLGRDDPFKPLIKVEKEKISIKNSVSIDKTVPKVVSELEKPPFILRGILKGEYSEVAILERVGREESFVVEKDKEIDGYHIIKLDINNNTITLRKNNKDYILKLVGDR
ncbi:MAG: hypothetical protein C0196_02725 [Dictyoglomus turgidum]|nr:MAG: hypothetical protein C0196_02725 [Dictyoglomus turgidum]